MGRFFCSLVRPSIRPSIRFPPQAPRASQAFEAWLAGSEACLTGSAAYLAGSEAYLAGSEACLATFWALERGTNGRTKNLPILQDFVLYWGRCPTIAQL